MSIKVASNRLIVSSITGFYQHLTRRISSFQELGSCLVKEAEYAQAFRHTNRIEELGIVLSNIPIKEYKLIGQYYIGWASYLKGGRPREIFEKIAEQSQYYKAKGLISLAVIEDHRGDYASELAYYNEALKCADKLSTKVDILRAIATVKAKEGFNKQSLRDLEQMWPFVRHSELGIYHQYLNSLAVELGEAGRIEEAQNVCRITLASPFVFAYPEWRETWQELALRGYKSRSVISVPKLPLKVKDNVIPIPVNNNPSPTKKSWAKVLDLQKLRKKMVKEPNGENEDVKNMDEKDLFLKLMQISTQDDITRKKLLKIVEYALKVTSEPD